MTKKITYNEIKITVGLDENQLPENIVWEATDGTKKSEAKATFVSFWDADSQQTMSLQLWVKDFETNEMKRFVHQSIVLLADTYEKAVGEEKLVRDMRDFTDYFAEKSGIIPPSGDFNLNPDKK
jgi:gliding motility-associated protein GldC